MIIFKYSNNTKFELFKLSKYNLCKNMKIKKINTFLMTALEYLKKKNGTKNIEKNLILYCVPGYWISHKNKKDIIKITEM